MFSSRDDYERVIKLLLAGYGRSGGPGELDADGSGDLRVRWTAGQLARADRYRLDVTIYPGGREPSELQLVLLRDDAWDPYRDDDDDDDDDGDLS